MIRGYTAVDSRLYARISPGPTTTLYVGLTYKAPLAIAPRRRIPRESNFAWIMDNAFASILKLSRLLGAEITIESLIRRYSKSVPAKCF